jgi:hypothetical protein
MNAETARTLVTGQKIKYWDDRIATVTVAWDGTGVTIVFDADPDPKPTCYIKDVDFMRAEPL